MDAYRGETIYDPRPEDDEPEEREEPEAPAVAPRWPRYVTRRDGPGRGSASRTA